MIALPYIEARSSRIACLMATGYWIDEKLLFVGVKYKILSILYTSNEVRKLFCFVQTFGAFGYILLV